MTAGPEYTRKVLNIAALIRGLTLGELLALRETLGDDFGLPPGAGVREPRNPSPLGGEGAAYAEEDS